MSTGKAGVLLVNLGTPRAATPAAVRAFLREFLSDRRVVEIPRLLWLPLLNLIILPVRAKRVAKLYAEIWGERGSPLDFHTRDQAAALGDKLDLPVEPAYRYGEPSVATAIDTLLEAGVDRIHVLPMYPQYSSTTTATVNDAVFAALAPRRNQPALHLVRDFHLDPGYIGALASSLREFWDQHGRGDHLLLSFHGLPVRNIQLGDTYQSECEATARALASELDLAEGDWSLTFQSRFGPAEWIGPSTDARVEELAKGGNRTLDVICPGFGADCLETLHEIAIETAELFTEAGGESLRYVPALNARDDFITALAGLLRRQGLAQDV